MCSRRFYQYMATFSVCSAVISFGTTGNWSSPYLPYLLSNSSDIPTTPAEGSWCAVAPLGGCIVGALISACLADKLGRKGTIAVIAPVTIVALICMAFVKYIWYLTLLRFTVGIADGAVFTVLPMYIGEIVDPDIRGFSASIIGIFYCFGGLIINSIGPFMTIFHSSLIAAAISALHLITFLLMPESPYYYIKIGNERRAEESLKKLRGTSEVHKEIDILKRSDSIEKTNISEATLTKLFTVASNKKACVIFSLLQFLSKMSGKVPLMLFTTLIFQESGSNIDPVLSVIIYSVTELVSVTFAGLVIDRFGKRILLIISCSGCCITIFVLAIYFYLKDMNSPIIPNLNWLPTTALVLHSISYSLGFGGCLMTYLSELFPMAVKPKATCLAEISSVTLGIATSQFFQITYSSYGMTSPFLCFSITCGVGVVLIYRIVPETKGKSLEEIQEFLIASCQKKM